MKKVLIGIGLLMIAAGLPAMSSPVVAGAGDHRSVGKGTIAIGHDDESVGLFNFEVATGQETTGSLLFAAEGHHGYPDVIVRVAKIDTATFAERSFTFTAKGLLHDEQVDVTGAAFDNAGTGSPDVFEIKVVSALDGEVVFEAEGEVFIGDIFVDVTE